VAKKVGRMPSQRQVCLGVGGQFRDESGNHVWGLIMPRATGFAGI
jgi:hypothetical protein